MSKLTREEAHWSSFRSAVLDLQHMMLSEHSSVPTETEENSKNERRGGNDHLPERNGIPPPDEDIQRHRKNGYSSSLSSSKQKTARETPQSALDGIGMKEDAYNENTKPESGSWDGASIETKHQSHQHLELIGLEEVNKIMYSRNNTVGSDLISPANAPSHASHTTNALSIAEQQLAETKLKLAMTESERDELEFQLMQNNS
ncbi:hypothetical protein ACHAXR_010634 [Thalassiosira sp. AJA248-18]